MKQVMLSVLLVALLVPAAFADLPGPEKVGEEMALTYTSERFVPSKSFDSEKLQLAWSEEIYMPHASYIAPHFGHFDLPEGAKAVVRSLDGSRSWTFEGYGKTDRYLKGGFWGIHIPGELAIVEVFSRVPLSGGEVVIDKFAHGYPAINEDDLSFGLKDYSNIGTKAICGSNDTRNAKCYSGSIYNESKAVARLLINGSSACTGWLVGSSGHLMTNNHCIGNSSAALNTNFEFMAEGNCSSNCSSWGACPGTVAATSSTFVQTHVNRDFTLVKLSSSLASTYGYMQMRSNGASNGERIYIPQHPAHWGKHIGVTSTHSSNPSGFCEVDSLNRPACIGGSESEVGYYCDTQGGSSGSPVLAYNDNCVVALHHCANCQNRGIKIQNVISSLNASGNLPPNALCGGSPPPPPPPSGCTAGSGAANNTSASTGNWNRYTWSVPANCSQYQVKISGGSGDADLYSRFGSQPTTSSYNCRPYLNGNNETCTHNNPSSGTWHIGVRAYSSFSGVRVEASHN